MPPSLLGWYSQLIFHRKKEVFQTASNMKKAYHKHIIYEPPPDPFLLPPPTGCIQIGHKIVPLPSYKAKAEFPITYRIGVITS